MDELNIEKLIAEAQNFWHDENGMLGMAAKAMVPIGQTLIDGRLFELQLVMTSQIEEIQLPNELIPRS